MNDKIISEAIDKLAVYWVNGYDINEIRKLANIIVREINKSAGYTCNCGQIYYLVDINNLPDSYEQYWVDGQWSYQWDNNPNAEYFQRDHGDPCCNCDEILP